MIQFLIPWGLALVNGCTDKETDTSAADDNFPGLPGDGDGDADVDADSDVDTDTDTDIDTDTDTAIDTADTAIDTADTGDTGSECHATTFDEFVTCHDTLDADGTLWVDNSLFTEFAGSSFAITKDLTIKGSDSTDRPILIAAEEDADGDGVADPALTVDGADVTFDDLVVDGLGDRNGINIVSGTVHLEDVDFEDTLDYAVNVGAGATLEDKSNTVGAYNVYSGLLGSAVVAATGATVQIADAIFKSIVSPDQAVIAALDSTLAELSGLIFAYNEGQLVNLDGTNSASVKNVISRYNTNDDGGLFVLDAGTADSLSGINTFSWVSSALETVADDAAELVSEAPLDVEHIDFSDIVGVTNYIISFGGSSVNVTNSIVSNNGDVGVAPFEESATLLYTDCFQNGNGECPNSGTQILNYDPEYETNDSYKPTSVNLIDHGLPNAANMDDSDGDGVLDDPDVGAYGGAGQTKMDEVWETYTTQVSSSS